MNFKPFIDAVLAIEGGYTYDKDDNGGETNFGITAAVARANGYLGQMRTMPESVARDIYTKRYIVEPKFNMVADLCSEVLAAELIDTGVNLGPHIASEYLQRWLNAFNSDGSEYADLFVDGRVGEHTIHALQKFLLWRGTEGEAVMLAALNSVQGNHYLEIAERNKAKRKFTYGWMRQRVMLQLKGLSE